MIFKIMSLCMNRVKVKLLYKGYVDGEGNITSKHISTLSCGAHVPTIGHIANSILLVTGGRKEPMAEVFAGNQLVTSIAVHTNHHSPSLGP